MITFALLSLLIVLGVLIIRQDIASLEISAVLIYAFFACCATLAWISPINGLGVSEHFVAGAIGGITAALIRIYFLKIRNIEGLGEADVWVIAAAGLMIGPFLLGPWLLLTSLIAGLLMLFSQRLSGRRNDPESAMGVTVMPLTPALIASTIILTIILRAEILPANQIPFL